MVSDLNDSPAHKISMANKRKIKFIGDAEDLLMENGRAGENKLTEITAINYIEWNRQSQARKRREGKWKNCLSQTIKSLESLAPPVPTKNSS